MCSRCCRTLEKLVANRQSIWPTAAGIWERWLMRLVRHIVYIEFEGFFKNFLLKICCLHWEKIRQL